MTDIQRKPGETTDAYNLRKLEEAFNEEEEFIDTTLKKEDTTKVKPDYNPEDATRLESGSYGLGEIGRHEYRGTESPAFAARHVLEKEKRLFDLKEGALVEIVLIGYNIPGLDQMEGKQRDKRQKQDTRIISLGGDTMGIAACYKIKDEPHPDGGTYRWVLPAVEGENYPETLSEFLIADEACKRLTPEQRQSATIEIQITNISEEELQERLNSPINNHQAQGFSPGETGHSYEVRDENGNVTKRVTLEDVEEMRKKIAEKSESDAQTSLDRLFGEDPEPQQKPEDPTIRRKRLSERLKKTDNKFKF